MTEKELVVATVLPSDLMPAGTERLSPGDVGMPPRLIISQPNRPVEINGEEVSPGRWVNTLTGESFESAEVFVLVYLNDTRVMWPESFDANNDPLCASDNGVMPSASSDVRTLLDPQPGPCASCPMSQFGDGGSAPRCKRQRNFLVWLINSEEPAILTMQSTALKEARQLTTLAQTAQSRGKSIFLSTRKIKDERGGWFVPSATKGNKLDPTLLPAIVEAKQELASLVVTADVATENGGGETAAPIATETNPGEDMPF